MKVISLLRALSCVCALGKIEREAETKREGEKWRETERQRDRETERQRDGETEGQRDREGVKCLHDD